MATLTWEAGRAVLADTENFATGGVVDGGQRDGDPGGARRRRGSAGMTLRLEHLLVPAHDQDRAARFLADLLGLDVTARSSGSAEAHFAVVRVQDITIDFATMDEVEPHHLAFAVDDATFDAILERIGAAGLTYRADPRHRRPGELNDNDGGRGMYVRDPDGHNLEFLTRPITDY